jgi:3-oxoacyl-[acyl-carrier protein] reductase
MNPNPGSRRVALVTGAPRGIGRACALALARASEPFDLAIHFNQNAAAAEALAEQLQRDANVRAQTLQADLTQSGAAQRLVDSAAEKFGRLDALIHSGGHIIEKPVAFTKPEEWESLFEVHAVSAAMLSKAALRYLRKAEHGRIVFIGSLAAEIGLGNGAAYAAAKGALTGLSKSLALEASRWKTTVNVIAPGYVDTEMLAAQDAERRAALIRGIPLGRYAAAEEVASLASYLCSSGAAYLTGQTIVVDGGASLG